MEFLEKKSGKSVFSRFSLVNKAAIVSGGTGWLGKPMCIALAEAGAKVYALGRSQDRLNELDQIAEKSKLEINAVECDITDESTVTNAVQRILDREKRIDILVNNASASVDGQKGFSANASAFPLASRIHLEAAWRLVTCSLPGLKVAAESSGGASVVNISSMYGKVSPDPRVYSKVSEDPNPAYYGAAKAGLIQLTRWLACWLGPEGIRVNSISPGPFPATEVAHSNPAFIAALREKVPLGRVGEPEEIGAPLLFLASQASSFVNGSDLAVDGGWCSW